MRECLITDFQERERFWSQDKSKFHIKIAIESDAATASVKATCLLHNIVQRNTTPSQCTTGMMELYHEEATGTVSPVDMMGSGRNPPREAKMIRDKFKTHVNEINNLPWLDNIMRREQPALS